MPEFSKSISSSPTDFGKVRSGVPTTGSGDVLAKGLTAVVQGVTTFGKASAREAGQEAALEQEGLDLSLEEVNTEVDNINSSIEKNLSVRQEEVGGKLTNRQVQESKDKSLRSLELTDRHIQGLIDAGTITSTEGNARRRMALAQKMNEGSNFLFKDEFVNAMSSVTGGSQGSASAAFFPKTSEEIRAESIAKEENKAVAEHEGKVAGLVALTGREESQVRKEMSQAQADQKFLADIEVKKANQGLNADDIAQQTDRLQALSTQQLEQTYAKHLVNGILSQENVGAIKGSVANQANQMRLALSNNKGLSVAARKAQNADIDLWETGQVTRVDSLSKATFDKNRLAAMESVVKIAGMEAFPLISIVSTQNSDLGTELGKLPVKAQEEWVKTRTSGDSRKALVNGLRSLAQLSSGNPVTDAGGLTLGLLTDSGMSDFTDPQSPNAPAWRRAQAAAPVETFVSLRRGFASKEANFDKNVDTRNKIINHYEFAKGALMQRVAHVGGTVPQVRLTPTPENLAGISQFHKTQFNETMDISDELAQYPDTVSIVEEGYKTFKKHPWMWNEDFDNPAEGYNAFLRGEFALKNGISVQQDPDKAEEKKEEAPKKVAPIVSPEERVTRVKDFENKGKEGFDGSVWKPHKSIEGGTDTVGFGHKLTSDEAKSGKVKIGGKTVDIKEGISDQQVEQLFNQDWSEADLGSQRILHKQGLKDLPEDAKGVIQEMVFQMGTTKVLGFKKFFEALKSKDFDAAAEEMLASDWAKEDSPERARVLANNIRGLGFND